MQVVSRKCERCEGEMSFYADETKEHKVWLCWACGRFKGSSSADDDFNDMIVVNPPLILELIKGNQLKPTDV